MRSVAGSWRAGSPALEALVVLTLLTPLRGLAQQPAIELEQARAYFREAERLSDEALEWVGRLLDQAQPASSGPR